MGYSPSKALFAGLTSGMRSLVRRVRSSASVKSSVNQPETDSAVDDLRGLRRSGNFVATSVVPPISFSCRATGTLSLVSTMSGSMTSAHCRMASAYAASVCSGR